MSSKSEIAIGSIKFGRYFAPFDKINNICSHNWEMPYHLFTHFG